MMNLFDNIFRNCCPRPAYVFNYKYADPRSPGLRFYPVHGYKSFRVCPDGLPAGHHCSVGHCNIFGCNCKFFFSLSPPPFFNLITGQGPCRLGTFLDACNSACDDMSNRYIESYMGLHGLGGMNSVSYRSQNGIFDSCNQACSSFQSQGILELMGSDVYEIRRVPVKFVGKFIFTDTSDASSA